jgi:hypothetical protein
MGHSSDSHIKTNRDSFPCSKFFLYRAEMLLAVYLLYLYFCLYFHCLFILILISSYTPRPPLYHCLRGTNVLLSPVCRMFQSNHMCPSLHIFSAYFKNVIQQEDIKEVIQYLILGSGYMFWNWLSEVLCLAFRVCLVGAMQVEYQTASGQMLDLITNSSGRG